MRPGRPKTLRGLRLLSAMRRLVAAALISAPWESNPMTWRCAHDRKDSLHPYSAEALLDEYVSESRICVSAA